MQSSDFERALHERVEFAVFVAYEQWAQASGYDSHNPYDLLARLLPGLPQALSNAVEARGGWGMLDPVGGLPSTGAQVLIAQAVGAVVDRMVGTMADGVHGQAVLAEQVAHAVGRAVNGFVGDPESWRLATIASPPGSTAARGDVATDAMPGPAAPTGPEATGAAPAGLSAAPAAAAAAAEAAASAGAWETGAPASAINEIETWLHSFLANPGSASGQVDSSVALHVASIGSFQAVADAMTVSPGLPVTTPALGSFFYDVAGDAVDSPTAVEDTMASFRSADPSGAAPGSAQALLFPSSLELAISHWLHLLETATFFRGGAGQMFTLSQAEAHEVVVQVIDTLVRNAELQMNVAVGTSGWDAKADAMLATASGTHDAGTIGVPAKFWAPDALIL